MRFHPIIVPSPSAIATATFTHVGNEPRRRVHVLLVIVQTFPIGRADRRLPALLHQAQGFAGTYISLRKFRTRSFGIFGQLSKQCRLVADVRSPLTQGQHGVGSEFLGANVIGKLFPIVADHRIRADILRQDAGRLLRNAMKSSDCERVIAWFKA
jgi:hypothetical protein